MIRRLKSKEINGVLVSPSSKSYAQRAIAAGLLTENEVVISNSTWCDDVNAAVDVVRRLGAKVVKEGDEITVSGSFASVNDTINCGEAGLGVRMFTPIVALLSKEMTITGSGGLMKRPISMLESPLKQLGAKISTNDGFLPMTLKGPITGGFINVDGSLSSQMLTGLLMALPKVKNNSQLMVRSLKSKPYIDITISVLEHFGIKISHENYERFYVNGKQKYSADFYKVEGDWSGASFLLVAGAIGGEVLVKNLNLDSVQADKAILEALKSAGAIIKMSGDEVKVERNKLNAFDFNATECPDLFPPLVALASACEGDTCIKGVSRLKYKESDRATVLQKEFGSLGVEIFLDGDLMTVKGNGKIKGGKLFAHNDHRIAMAGAVASIIADNEVIIENAESVSKSYPEFWEDFEKL